MKETFYEITDLPAEGDISVLLFGVGEEMFAINVEQTEGVVDCPRVTPLPGAQEPFVGVSSIRGRMTVVVDLNRKGAQNGKKQRLILIRGEAQLGLVADRIEGVLSLTPVREPARARGLEEENGESSMESWPAAAYFRSGGRVVPVLDLERLAEG
ncbi:MAG TPA: chemotaxis protein CheW [Blastocatellia bacterium]|jgi:chemotaxis signal transduction protein